MDLTAILANAANESELKKWSWWLPWIIAVLSLGWAIWTWRRTRTERVDVQLNVHDEPGWPSKTLQIEIVNTSDQDIFIPSDGVTLELPRDMNMQLSQNGNPVPLLGLSVKLTLRTEDSAETLAPKHPRIYRLPFDSVQLVSHIRKDGLSDFALSVRSSTGELHRTECKQLVKLLDLL